MVNYNHFKMYQGGDIGDIVSAYGITVLFLPGKVMYFNLAMHRPSNMPDYSFGRYPLYWELGHLIEFKLHQGKWGITYN